MARQSITQKVTNHLIQNPSYFKWSAKRIADKLNCSTKTVNIVIRNLDNIKREYLRTLNS